MASKILLEKRKNLLEMNKNSIELFLNKGFINILTYVDPQILYDFAKNKEMKEIIVTADASIERILADLRLSQNMLELKAKIEQHKLNYDTSKLDLQNGTEAQKENVINSINKSLFNGFKQLHTYAKDAAKEYYDSGKWCMYLCFGILETSFNATSNEKIVIRAPLLCLPIGVKKKSESSYILYKRDNIITGNEILNIYLKDKFDISYLNQEQLETLDTIDDILASIASKIPNCVYNSDAKGLEEVRKVSYQAYNGAKVDNCCFVSLLNPVGGKMLEDYDAIISSDYVFPQENSMFANQGLDKVVYQNDDVLEVGRLLNVNQKKAVIASLKTNTLIYGPPGTGKSEVVTSIVANNVNEGFNVLISSEKKAALDVIRDRLDALKAITMIIDPEDPNKFYDHLIELNEIIIKANKVDVTKIKPEYTNLVNYLNNLIDVVNDQNKFNEVFNLGKQEQEVPTAIHANEGIYATMLEKIKQNQISINDFVHELYRFHKPARIIAKFYPINSSIVHIFKKDNVERLFNALQRIEQENRRFYTIDNFVRYDRPKPGLFCKKIEPNQVDQAELMMEAFNLIRNNPQVAFFINYSQWLTVIDTLSEESLIKELEIYSKQNQETLKPVFTNINTGKILYSYLDEYWNASINKAAQTSAMVAGNYIFNLKTKFIADPSLQEKWIEMVKKAHLPTKINLAKFIKDYYQTLKFIFPIWILSPDNVANYIPLANHEFSVGIFDEASQMRMERSFPLVYRCTRSVVSGDDKQLRPSRFFAASLSFDAEDLTSQEELDNVESLLDKAKIANWSSFTLSNHYRSDCEELIGFSNKYIYDGNLLCITKNGCNNTRPIEVIQMPVTTVYDRHTNTNPDEAKQVVQYILGCSNKYKKIVIITFNQKQADLIESICYQHPPLTVRLEQDTIRIRSIENVQGDEADLVVISTTFGKDADGKFIQNFGPVGQAGGKNRINVMVTRAKTKMVIIKSFMSDLITSTNNENLFILKMFLFYVENLQNNKNVILSQATGKMAPKQINTKVGQELMAALPGYNINCNYMIGSHGFNIAITQDMNVKALLLIDEISDLKTNKDITKWIDSFDHQKYYQDRGYKVLRFNEVEWMFNKPQIIEKIKNLIQ